MSLGSQRFCLRWNNHQSNLLSVFDQLLHDESFVDVTLAVEGQFLRAHKMVLSACSPYFQTLFVGHPDKHPIVILKDVPYADMRSLLDFMYRGEVSVDQDRLTAFLKVAESLRIKGLTEVNEERCDLPSIASSLLNSSPLTQGAVAQGPPPPHLHRIHHVQHKRALPPMAANPLLGSALTAPKRKRGRPRKLSGGDQPNSNGTNDPDDATEQLTSSRAESPVMHNAPELVEVNMSGCEAGSGSVVGDAGDVSTEETSPTDDRPGTEEGEGGGGAVIKTEPGQDCHPTPSTSILNATADGDRCSSVDVDPSRVKVKLEEDVDQSVAATGAEANNNNYDVLCGGHEIEEEADECYDDMIACSPASCLSEDDECRVGGRRPDVSIVKQEQADFLDEDISQYEMDSFRSMMASYGAGPAAMIPRLPISPTLASSMIGSAAMGVAGSGHAHRSRPIDKASVRRYCTHEADNVYRCNFCSKTYTHISNFCRHFLSAHHGIRQEIPCPVCFKLFTRKDNMMTHTKQVHRLNLVRGGSTSEAAGTAASASNAQSDADTLQEFVQLPSLANDPS